MINGFDRHPKHSYINPNEHSVLLMGGEDFSQVILYA